MTNFKLAKLINLRKSVGCKSQALMMLRLIPERTDTKSEETNEGQLKILRW